MGTTHYTQHMFLWCMGAIYMFAFTSLYFQIPGLYGKNGILPAATQLIPTELCMDNNERCTQWSSDGECESNPTYMLKNCKKSCGVCKQGQDQTLKEKLALKLTLLWLSPYLGLDIETGMELICILGTVISFCVLLFPRWRNKFTFLALWVLYFSVYQVGQTFLWFQWDILLLETGVLTIFVAPLFMFTPYEASPDTTMLFWLIKWLLFRLMFASGVVKLTSMCPTWWGLTALNWHYESQCIPTPLAWYAHQLPEWFQKLSVAATFVIEIGIPFLFFSPLRSLRIFAFYSQVLLQVLIILTGNYNFFNLLTLALCLSLVDDEFIVQKIPSFLRRLFFRKPLAKKEKGGSSLVGWICFMNHWCTIIIICIVTVKLFNLRIGSNVILSEVAFSKPDFLRNLKSWTPISVVIGIIGFCIQVFLAFYRTLFGSGSKLKKSLRLLKCCWLTYVGVWLFGMSLVPLTELDQDTRNGLWPVIHRWYKKANKYHVTNSYGLFRSMTGVGGRPELIIEGSDNINGKWREYNFLFKPGNVSERLPFCAPHQPRLDWQMWFAALGSYEHNPWFVHLIYKLLHGQKEVLDLMGHNPFPNKPPKYVRSKLYKYHYTVVSMKHAGIVDGILRTRKIKKWWKREFSHEYTPALEKDDPSLVKYVRSMGWDPDRIADLSGKPSGFLYNILCNLRKFSIVFNPTIFMFQLLLIPIVTEFLYLYIPNFT